MASLEDKIKDLEEEIAGYRVSFDAATTENEKQMYANLIIASKTQLTEKERQLTALLQQQQQQQQQQQAQAGGGQATIDNNTALTAAVQELTNELRIRRGVGSSRGSSNLTPSSGQETSDEVHGEGMVVSGVSIKGSDEKRYAELFRACLRKHNSDCNVKYSRFGFKVMKGDSVVFRCPFAKRNIKNAYALFRIQCQDNINSFESALNAYKGDVPDFDGETPP